MQCTGTVVGAVTQPEVVLPYCCRLRAVPVESRLPTRTVLPLKVHLARHVTTAFLVFSNGHSCMKIKYVWHQEGRLSHLPMLQVKMWYVLGVYSTWIGVYIQYNQAWVYVCEGIQILLFGTPAHISTTIQRRDSRNLFRAFRFEFSQPQSTHFYSHQCFANNELLTSVSPSLLPSSLLTLFNPSPSVTGWVWASSSCSPLHSHQ